MRIGGLNGRKKIQHRIVANNFSILCKLQNRHIFSYTVAISMQYKVNYM